MAKGWKDRSYPARYIVILLATATLHRPTTPCWDSALRSLPYVSVCLLPVVLSTSLLYHCSITSFILPKIHKLVTLKRLSTTRQGINDSLVHYIQNTHEIVRLETMKHPLAIACHIVSVLSSIHGGCTKYYTVFEVIPHTSFSAFCSVCLWNIYTLCTCPDDWVAHFDVYQGLPALRLTDATNVSHQEWTYTHGYSLFASPMGSSKCNGVSQTRTTVYFAKCNNKLLWNSSNCFYRAVYEEMYEGWDKSYIQNEENMKIFNFLAWLSGQILCRISCQWLFSAEILIYIIILSCMFLNNGRWGFIQISALIELNMIRRNRGMDECVCCL